MGQLREQLVQNADKLHGASLCDVLWSLGILDDLPVDTFKQLASLLEQQPLRDFQPRVLRSIHDSCRNACLCRLHFQTGVLQHVGPYAPRQDTLSPDYLHAGFGAACAVQRSDMCDAVTTQDFRRLYEVQRIVQACLLDDERGQVVLPGWMRAYAAAAWQDRFFAEQNFTPLQQVRQASPGQSQALGTCVMNVNATNVLRVVASL